MNHALPTPRRHRSRGALVLGGALLVLCGATWSLVQAATAPAWTADGDVAHASTPHRMAGRRDSYSDIVKAVAPSVVTIRTEGRTEGQAGPAPIPFQGPMRAPKQRGLGSGVVVDGHHILTNHHVIDHADDVRVETPDGRTLTAKVIGVDPASDLAVLEVPGAELPPLALGDSEAVEVGDVVLAIGNPLGVGQTVTMGIISAKGRSTGAGHGGVSYEDFLQTDAPINHGNSGGALVNMNGELIGINSQILSESGGNIGIGFAIPSAMVKHVMGDLLTKGKVTRAQLGVSVQGLTSDLAEGLGLKDVNGVVIGEVLPGSAAERAGLERGDVIRSFDGRPVRDTNALRNRVADVAPGTEAELVIVRDGDEKRFTVKLDEARTAAAELPAEQTANDELRGLGLAVKPVTPALAEGLALPKETEGLLVEEVAPDGRAAGAGLQVGDVILEAGRKPVRAIEDLRAAAAQAKERPLLLLVKREGHDYFVSVRLGDD